MYYIPSRERHICHTLVSFPHSYTINIAAIYYIYIHYTKAFVYVQGRLENTTARDMSVKHERWEVHNIRALSYIK